MDPPTSATGDRAQQQWQSQLTQVLRTGLGQSKDKSGKFLTWTDLENEGIVVSTGGPGGSGGGHIVNPDSGGSSVPEEDRTPPPAPENVSADGGMTAIYVTWDDPGLDYNYRVEIHRSAVDDVGTAVLHGSGIGTIYQDVVGSDKTLYYYWARFVKQLSTEIIVGPWNQTAGTPGQAGEDPEWVLDQISGKFDADDLKTQVFTVDLFGVKGTDPKIERMAFAIDTTTTPPRVAMDGAYIIDATIGDAKIENLTVDKLIGGTADFVEANIREGSIINAKIGNVVQSNNYQTDVDGWHINKNGYSEFQNGYFRGTITASVFNGGVINGGEINGGIITGSTIIGSTIYASDTVMLADPWGDGRVTYYDKYPDIPVSCGNDFNESLSEIYIGPSAKRVFISTPVSAGYHDGEISSIRYRWHIVAKNLQWNFRAGRSGGMWISCRILIVDPITHKARTTGNWIKIRLNDYSIGDQYDSVGGISFLFKSATGSTLDSTRGYIEPTNATFTFGHPTDDSLNGQIAMEIWASDGRDAYVTSYACSYDNTVHP